MEFTEDEIHLCLAIRRVVLNRESARRHNSSGKGREDNRLRSSMAERREYMRAWRKANRERLREQHRVWVKQNSEQARSLMRDSQRRYVEQNRTLIYDKNRRWAKAHPEQVREIQRTWDQTHREAGIAKCHKRRAHIKGNGGSWTAQEWQTLKRQYGFSMCRLLET